MASKLKIVNIALRRLGCEPVSSLNDDSKSARVMNDIYNEVRQHLLESFNWSFANKRVKLTADTVNSPAFEYANQFDLPNDYLRAISEYNDAEYKREGDLLLSDESTLELKYISDFTDEKKFSASFTKLMYLTLADEGGYSLTQDKALKDRIKVDREDAERRAMSFSSQESTPEDFDFDHFNNFRL